jgi:hypothetical protein
MEVLLERRARRSHSVIRGALADRYAAREFFAARRPGIGRDFSLAFVDVVRRRSMTAACNVLAGAHEHVKESAWLTTAISPL